MFKKWYRLRVGLMALVILGGMLALSFSLANAAQPPKPPAEPPVKYTMRLMPSQGESLCAGGMNNYGQVVAWGYVWDTIVASGGDGEVTPLTDLVLDPTIEVVPSAQLVDTWEQENQRRAAEYQRIVDENYRRAQMVPPLPPLPLPLLVFVAWPYGVVGLRFEYGTINDFGQGTAAPITDFGQIAADFEFLTSDGTSTCHAFRYTPRQYAANGDLIHKAQFIDLGPPAGWETSSARAINNKGSVVGHAEGNPNYGSVAVLWRSVVNPDGPVVLDEGFSANAALIDSRASAVNDDDKVTGYMLKNGAAHAFRYTPTTVPPLDLGILYPRNPGSTGLDINNSGQVAGWSYVTRPKDSYWEKDGIAHAFRYTASMVDLGVLTTGGSTHGFRINNKGHVVGGARTGAPGWTPTWFLYTETGMLDVWKLIDWENSDPAAQGATFADVYGVYGMDMNDYPGHEFGQICGTIDFGGMRPFILTPNK